MKVEKKKQNLMEHCGSVVCKGQKLKSKSSES